MSSTFCYPREKSERSDDEFRKVIAAISDREEVRQALELLLTTRDQREFAATRQKLANMPPTEKHAHGWAVLIAYGCSVPKDVWESVYESACSAIRNYEDYSAGSYGVFVRDGRLSLSGHAPAEALKLLVEVPEASCSPVAFEWFNTLTNGIGLVYDKSTCKLRAESKA